MRAQRGNLCYVITRRPFSGRRGNLNPIINHHSSIINYFPVYSSTGSSVSNLNRSISISFAREFLEKIRHGLTQISTNCHTCVSRYPVLVCNCTKCNDMAISIKYGAKRHPVIGNQLLRHAWCRIRRRSIAICRTKIADNIRKVAG